MQKKIQILFFYSQTISKMIFFFTSLTDLFSKKVIDEENHNQIHTEFDVNKLVFTAN